MHGMLELVVFLAFLGTALAAFALRLTDPPRPVPIMLLVGCWPAIAGLFTAREDVLAAPAAWLAGTAVTLFATLIGSAFAAALLHRRAKGGTG